MSLIHQMLFRNHYTHTAFVIFTIIVASNEQCFNANLLRENFFDNYLNHRQCKHFWLHNRFVLQLKGRY